MARSILHALAVLSMSAASAALAEAVGPAAAPVRVHAAIHAPLEAAWTLPQLGAGQAIARDGEFYYLLGDADTGVIREYTFDGDAADAQTPPLRFTGRAIRLTRGGEDLAPHPTGLAIHPEFGAFLGDTVRQRGIIFHLDWQRALQDGNLDHAVRNVTVDDLAANGTRPQFIEFDGRTLVATADYGDQPAERGGNHVRLYDPARLARASRTSADGVLVHAWPAGPFVQSLVWVDRGASSSLPDHDAGRGLLVLVQNQTAGRGFRLTFCRLDRDDPDLRDAPTIDLADAEAELEGFALLDAPLPAARSTGPTALYLTAHATNNLRAGPLEAP